MHQGNWKCSGCGGAITELPFQPRSEAGLTCRTCYAKGKGGNKSSYTPAPAPEMASADEMPFDDVPDFADVASEPMPSDDGLGQTIQPGEKAKFSGDWRCAGCGGSITSLPFSPRDTSNLKCLDCFKSSR